MSYKFTRGGIRSKPRKGFSLAEVLVVVFLIGVIVIETIPIIVIDFQEKAWKSAFKKKFSELEQVGTMVLNDNGGDFSTLCSGTNWVAWHCLRDAFKTRLKYVKECDWDEIGGECFHNTGVGWYYYDGDVVEWTASGAGLVLMDGTLVKFKYGNPYSAAGTYTRYGDIYVDVNGFKSPNTIGKDIFPMHIFNNRIIPQGIPDDGRSCNDEGYGCAAKVIQNEDY